MATSLDDILKEVQSLKGDASFSLSFDNKKDIIKDIIDVGNTIKDNLNPITFTKSVTDIGFGLDQMSAQMAKTFGVAKDQTKNIQNSIALSYKDVISMGGNFQNIAQIQSDMTKTFNTNLIATADNIKDIYATQSVTNVEPDKLIQGFRSVGMSMSHIKDEMQKVVDYSSSIGVNVTEVSKKVVDNIGKLNLYNFQGGVEGLTKMAAQSAMLGIDMGKTFKLSEDLLDPQKAIDLSASLQRLGVTSSELLDPLRAMDLAQNDPEELQNQLVKLSEKFVQVGKDGKFEIMPGAKRELREVAQALGMSADELANMALNSADFSKKMSDIRMPSIATEEQKTLIANMAQLNKNTGKYEISLGLDESGKEIKKSIDDLPGNNKELTEMLDRASKAKDKPRMETLAEQQLSELQNISKSKAMIEAAGKIEEAVKNGEALTKTYADFFKKASEKMVGDKEQFRKDSEKLLAGPRMTDKERRDKIEEKGYAGAMIDIGKNMTDDYIKIGGTQTLGALEIVTTEISKAITNIPGIPPELLTKMTAMSTALNTTIDTLKKGLENGNITSKEILENVKKITESEAFKKLGTIFDKLGSMTKIGGSEIMNTISEVLHDFIITKDGVYKYSEGDIMIGGTNLDGKQNKEIKGNLPTTTNTNENIDKLENKTISIGEVQMLVQSLHQSFGEFSKYIRTPLSLDFSPLTMVMSKMFEKFNSVSNSDVDNNPRSGKYDDAIARLSMIQKSPTTELKEGILKTPEKNFGQTNDYYLSKLTEIVSTYKKDLNPITTISGGLPKTLEEPIKPIPSTVKAEELSTSKLSLPSQLTTTQTQKHEFGQLEIVVKVDIPNRPDMQTEQIKNVLETTMRSTEFQQSLVVAVNKAKTDNGTTSQGGTSNYGNNLTNFGLNT